MSTVISHKYKFIFIHVPKTGGSSFMTRFSNNWKHLDKSDLVLGGHVPYTEIKKDYPEEWRSYYKVAFVRNPWDRAVSLWILRGGRTSFLEFLNKIKNLKGRKPKMLRTQTSYIGDGSELDFIGRFEFYQPTVYYLMGKLGFPLTKLKYIRITPNRTKDYAPHYVPGCRKLVTEIYKEDIKNFGYKFK